MEHVHLTQYFRTDSPEIFSESERLMEALVNMEDGEVFDSAVSADSGEGVLTVEVVARGVNRTAAEQAALARIRKVLDACGSHVEEQEEFSAEGLALA